MMAVRISRRRLTNCAQNPKSQRSAGRRLGARRRERCRTRSCCFKRIFSARTARVPPVPRRTASLASRCAITKIAFFMDKQLAQQRTQEQGIRIAASGPLNYEFAMYRVIESRLHHCLDVSMQEDLSRVRTPRSALALGMIRRVVLSLSNAAVDKARKKNPKTKSNTKSFRQRFLSARGGRERLQALILAQHPAVLDLEG